MKTERPERPPISSKLNTLYDTLKQHSIMQSKFHILSLRGLGCSRFGRSWRTQQVETTGLTDSHDIKYNYCTLT